MKPLSLLRLAVLRLARQRPALPQPALPQPALPQPALPQPALPQPALLRLARLPLALLLPVLISLAASAAEGAHRHSAPIVITQPGAFVQLALPASAYARSQQVGLADLRVVDARGERVPFALLPARESVAQNEELLRPATLYALPQRRAPGASLVSPVEVIVQGDRISVRQLGGTTSKLAASAVAAPTGSPGWLIDLGERPRDEPAPHALRLAWTGPAEFSAAFDIDASNTLREWRAIGSGQLLALAPGSAQLPGQTSSSAPLPGQISSSAQLPTQTSSSGPLVQRDVLLSAGGARFLRLVWRDAATAPALSGAQAVVARQTSQVLDASTELRVAPSPEPAGKTAPPKNALHFDLGGALPVVALDLKLPSGIHVAPVRLQGRSRGDEAWRDIGQSVFYWLQRDAAFSTSPPLALRTTVRYVRVLPDERSPALDPALTTLLVQVRLARLVIALQGSAPYTLLAGSADAGSGALPLATLVPALEDERARFGRAELGVWTEQPEVARAAESAKRMSALRPWLLWAVLLAGVAGLGFMVWRLIPARPAA